MLFNQLLRPRLRNLTAEVFKDISYVLDDEAYSTRDNQEYVRKRFIRAWESVVEGYKVVNVTDFKYILMRRLRNV